MDKIREKQEAGGLEEGGLPGEDGLPVVGPRMDPKVCTQPRASTRDDAHSRPHGAPGS